MGKTCAAIALPLVLASGFAAGADNAPAQALFLRCEGPSSSRGIDAPADVAIATPEIIDQTFVVEPKRLRIADHGQDDQVLALCSESATAKVFSDACHLTAEAFVSGWRDSISKPAPRGQRSRGSNPVQVVFNRIEVDRVTWRARWHHVLSVIRSDPGHPPVHQVYFVEDVFRARCTRSGSTT